MDPTISVIEITTSMNNENEKKNANAKKNTSMGQH